MSRFAAIRTIGTMLAMFACVSVCMAGNRGTLGEPSSVPANTPALATHTCVQAGTNSQEAPQAPARDVRSLKQEPVRRTVSVSLHAHQPQPQRNAKIRSRTTPATLGMGMLLRAGTGAGHELSQLIDVFTSAPSPLRSGRAPPFVTCPSTLARDPIACAAASEPHTVTAESVPPSVTPSTTSPIAFRSVDHSQGWEFARIGPSASRRTGSFFGGSRS
jgi:hypothetical protein